MTLLLKIFLLVSFFVTGAIKAQEHALPSTDSATFIVKKHGWKARTQPHFHAFEPMTFSRIYIVPELRFIPPRGQGRFRDNYREQQHHSFRRHHTH